MGLQASCSNPSASSEKLGPVLCITSSELHFVMALRRKLRNQTRYSPSQSAPVSGIYSVYHGSGHREDHDLILVRGEDFAACRSCKGNVQFTLKKQASHIRDDLDFAARTELTGSPDYFRSRLDDLQSQLSRAQRDYADALQQRQRARMARERSQAPRLVWKSA
jgi:hypothetical protein